jgi:hypothetical protein
MRHLSSSFSRAIALVAGVFGLGTAAPAAASATDSGQAEVWAPNDDDALLFDVRLGKYRLGDGVRGYRTPAGVCIDTADMIMALDVPVRLDKKLRRATGWAFDERHTILIDREANSEQIANNKRNLTATTIFDAPEGWCADVAALSRWFGITIETDLSNAIIVIKAPTKLPVELSIERRERAAKIRPETSFDLRSLPQSKMPYRGIKTPSVDVVVNFGIAEEKGKTDAALRYALYATGEVGPVAYDARLASSENAAPESLRIRAYRSDPDGLLFGPLRATHVAAGDVSGLSSQLVAQSTVGRGASITNQPIERQQTFDKTDFRGELPAGWDAELYRNDQLLSISVDRADGRYEFLDVPLLYGRNRFEVVLYGPQGQVRREERMIMVGADSIPPRENRYSASMVQDGEDLIDFGEANRAFGTQRWRGSVQLERGLNARTSLSLGYHNLYVQQVGRRNFLEAGVRRALGPALFELTGSSDLQGGSAVKAQMLAQFGSTYVAAESVQGFGGYRSDRLRSGVTGESRLSIDRIVKLGAKTLPVHFDAAYVTRASGQRNLTADMRVSSRVGRVNMSSFLEIEREIRPFGPNPPDVMAAGFLGNGRIGRVSLRGEARFRVSPGSSFEHVTLTGEWAGKGDGKHRADWRSQFDYDARSDVARVALGYVRRFDKLALTAQAGLGTDGAVNAGLNLSFSLGPDPRKQGGIRFTSSRIAGNGQILARVYRDANLDGVRQPDEPWEKDVQIAAGRVPVDRLTDGNGEVMIDDLSPFRPVLIGIDAGSLADPLVQPVGPGLVITPRPGVTGIVELALTSAGEVDGTLVRTGGNGIEGVDLELINLKGVPIATTRTDFDGFFLFESVPYGKYTVRVGKLSAEITQLNPQLGSTLIDVNAKIPSAHLGVVAADPAAPRIASSDASRN